MNLLRRAIIQAVGGSFNLAESFQTTIYTGNGSSQDIVSGLDFTAKDGLVWAKARDVALGHVLMDSIRGTGGFISSDDQGAESSALGLLVTSYNNDGFSIGLGTAINQSTKLYVAWQFMEQEGFFDIVKYVGNGVAGMTVNHNLNADFGMVLIKNIDNGFQSWAVQHKDLPATGALALNTTAAFAVGAQYWNNTAANDTVITIGNGNIVNENTSNHMAYIFAHNPGGGIFCGSYTGTGAAGNKQVTTFPVGWLLIKDTDAANNWIVVDVARSPSDPRDKRLILNTLNTEITSSIGTFDADGFELSTSNDVNGSGREFIYMAIADPAQL